MEKLTLATIRDYAERFRNWNRWGENDEAGTLNYVTPEKIVAAARLVQTGRTFALAINFDAQGPQTGSLGRFNPVHAMLATGTDAVAGHHDHIKVRYADDIVAMPMHGATHWDSLSHIFYEDSMWNGYDARLVGAGGAKKNGIERVKDRILGRGVLLDVARYKGRDCLDDGYGITSADLDACAAEQKVEIQLGDFVLVRTGQLERCLEQGWGEYAGGDAPGLAFETVEWLAKHQVAGVASDTWGVEVRPNETDDAYQPWHWVTIPNMGLTVGEIFYLAELAEDCKKDERYEFFFVAPPLPITGGSGSPVNPIAIK